MRALADRGRRERLLALGLVGAAHAAALWLGLRPGPDAPAPPVSRPLAGTLVSAPPGAHAAAAAGDPRPTSAPRPLPVAPRQARTPPRAAPAPSAPLPAGPPSELAVGSLAPEAAAPSPAAAGAEESVGEEPGAGAVLPPRSGAGHLTNPPPAYPRLSRRLREEGRVLLDVLIAADGSVREVRLRRTSGHPRLDGAALEAVRRWRYVPARRGEQPIDFWHVQPIDFELSR